MNESLPLFPSLPTSTSDEQTTQSEAAPRLVSANRTQLQLRPVDVDSLVGPDHTARVMWRFVERLDLTAFLDRIQAREGVAGRSAIDPKILLTLWLYATSDGVGSARRIGRLCDSHDAYRWICGGVSINHHSLSDFRNGHAAALDGLFAQVLATMMSENLVTLTRVAQDGTRVRASAGGASFRRGPSLRKLLKAAKKQVEHVKQLGDDPSVTARETAARKRAAREKEERIERALAQLPAVVASKNSTERKKNARVSTTDPDARVMKMADGGFRPAYNIQLATTTAEKVIVGVSVTNIGSDQGQMDPMRAQIEERTGEHPKEYLVDGGYVKKEAFEKAEKEGTKIYAPPMTKKTKEGKTNPYEPKHGDSEEIIAWRKRMATPEGKTIYRERAATAELVNADMKEHRGLKLMVRGTQKVLAVALMHALVYNLMRWAALTS